VSVDMHWALLESYMIGRRLNTPAIISADHVVYVGPIHSNKSFDAVSHNINIFARLFIFMTCVVVFFK